LRKKNTSAKILRVRKKIKTKIVERAKIMYESPTKGLTAEEVKRRSPPSNVPPKAHNGKCIHLPNRPVYRTIAVRDSLRVMDMCEGCYGVMERAVCIAEILL